MHTLIVQGLLSALQNLSRRGAAIPILTTNGFISVPDTPKPRHTKALLMSYSNTYKTCVTTTLCSCGKELALMRSYWYWSVICEQYGFLCYEPILSSQLPVDNTCGEALRVLALGYRMSVRTYDADANPMPCRQQRTADEPRDFPARNLVADVIGTWSHITTRYYDERKTDPK